MSKKIDRRAVIGGLATGTAAAGVSAPAYAQGKRRLKMVTTWPKNFPASAQHLKISPNASAP